MPGFLICKCEPCDALIVAELVDASPPHCPGCGAGQMLLLNKARY